MLESPTASGKTLAFTVPLLDSQLRNPAAHALMIYQMNALSFDQLEKIREFCDLLEITVDTYIRETGEARRREIRENPPRILLTNPEYLNDSFLGWREKHWNQNGFLGNLCYLVIDEMHLYHGYFGNNMTLLLRRFFLQLHRLGASPRVFLSTATCANPDKHAEILTGRIVKHVKPCKDMSPTRHFLFVKPEDTEGRNWKNLSLRIERAVLAMLERDLRALVFCPSINFLENARRNCTRVAEKKGLDTSSLAVYHSRLPDEEKVQTRQKIRSGEHTVIFTTNSLEVGLDIGGLDGIVLAGFPSNVMSAWQRIGRAGRNWENDAFVLFFALNDPWDQYFVSDVKSFLRKSLDELVVDPTNEHMINSHMDSLMEETNGVIRPDDKPILGEAFYSAAVEAAKTFRPRRRSFGRMRESPQRKLSARGLRGDNRGTYILEIEGEEIGKNIPDIWRFRHAFKGAIFTFGGNRYCVDGHDTTGDKKKIVLKEEPLAQRTEAIFHNYINVDEEFDCRHFDDFTIFYGEVNLNIKFDSYSVVDEASDAVLERMEPEPQEKFYERTNLHAIWIEFSGEDQDAIGIYTLLQLLRDGARFAVPADRFDTSAFSRLDESTVFLHENHRGGIGIVKRLFDFWHEALEAGIKRAQNCPDKCVTGCPLCMAPAKYWDTGGGEVDKQKDIGAVEMPAREDRGS